HERHFLLVHVGPERVRHRRLEHAGEEVHAVALHELARLRQALVGLVTGRALEQDLDAAPAGAIADLTPVEHVRVAHVDAELCERARPCRAGPPAPGGGPRGGGAGAGRRPPSVRVALSSHRSPRGDCPLSGCPSQAAAILIKPANSAMLLTYGRAAGAADRDA